MSKLKTNEKGKLAERQGRKAMGLKLPGATIAKLPNSLEKNFSLKEAAICCLLSFVSEAGVINGSRQN